MGKRLAIAALCLISHGAWAIDPTTPTISGAGDIGNPSRHSDKPAVGTTTLPTTLPRVTRHNIGNSFPGYNVPALTGTSHRCRTASEHLGFLLGEFAEQRAEIMILNPGRQGTCDWRPSPLAIAYSRFCRRCSQRVLPVRHEHVRLAARLRALLHCLPVRQHRHRYSSSPQCRQ